MKFLRTFFASCLGFIVASIMLFFIFIFVCVAIIGSFSSQQEPVHIAENSILHLRLEGELQERTDDFSFDYMFAEKDFQKISLDELLTAIEKAADDDKIKGIYLEASTFSAGAGSLTEIRNALYEFKQTDKFILAYGGNYSQGTYYLASVADEILLNPSGSVSLFGMASQSMYLKRMMNNIGMEFQVVRAGKYKSAAESLLREDRSEEDRAQTAAYLSAVWKELVEDIAASRNLTAKEINKIADEYAAFKPGEELLQLGLIDSLTYQDEAIAYLKSKIGVDPSEKIKLLTVKELNTVPAPFKQDKIALVYAVGQIDGGGINDINSKKLVETLRKVKEDNSIKSVVLRINSPGGSAFGSEQIWRELSLLKKEKPLVISMGDLAASGGYYIACIGDYIFAQPTTLTGSIGVFGMYPSVEKLSDKIGVNTDVVKTNKYADMGNVFRPLNEEEIVLLQQSVNRTYDIFLTRCADGRDMRRSIIDSLAQGRVYAASQAVENGLIDSFGFLKDAIEEAAMLGEVSDYEVVKYPAKRDFITQMTEDFLPSAVFPFSFINKLYTRVNNHTGFMSEPEYMIRAEME